MEWHVEEVTYCETNTSRERHIVEMRNYSPDEGVIYLVLIHRLENYGHNSFNPVILYRT